MMQQRVNTKDTTKYNRVLIGSVVFPASRRGSISRSGQMPNRMRLPPISSPNPKLTSPGPQKLFKARLKQHDGSLELRKPLLSLEQPRTSKAKVQETKKTFRTRLMKQLSIEPKTITPQQSLGDLFLDHEETRFQNPAITMDQKTNRLPQETIEEDISQENTFLKESTKRNRLMEMKQVSSHSSSNSGKLLQFSDGKQSFPEEDNSRSPDQDMLEFFGKEFKKKNWVQGEFLGAGSFSQVFLATDTETGQKFALKKIDITKNFDNEKDLETLQGEVILMKKMRHPHIIKYLGHEQTETTIYIYLEYMSKGSLRNILSHNGAFEEPLIKNYATQVLDGLRFLHKHRVIHGDIKGANVLVNKHGVVKIGDLGCSSQLGRTMTIHYSQDSNRVDSLDATGSTILMLSTKLITQTSCNTSADIWSFGCTVLEMASGKVPWSEYNFDNIGAAICKIGLDEDIPSIPETVSEDLRSFILCCLQRDPKKRSTAEQLIQHKFLKE